MNEPKQTTVVYYWLYQITSDLFTKEFSCLFNFATLLTYTSIIGKPTFNEPLHNMIDLVKHYM